LLLHNFPNQREDDAAQAELKMNAWIQPKEKGGKKKRNELF